MARIITAKELVPGARGSGLGGPNIPPLYSINLTQLGESGEPEPNETEIYNWLVKATEELEQIHNLFVWQQELRRQLYLYGTVDPDTDRGSFNTGLYGDGLISKGTSTFAINKIYNAVETMVAKITKFQSSVVVSPAQGEYSDQQSAKLGKMIADHIWYINKAPEQAREIVRHCFVDGEVFATARWNESMGDEDGENVERPTEPVVDSDGEEVLSESGARLFKQASKTNGDVKLGFTESRFILLEPKNKFQDVDWYIEIEVRYIDDLKSKYPDFASELEGGNFGACNWPWIQLSEQECLTYRIKHRSTAQFPGGCTILVCGERVLEFGAYDLENQPNKLDIVRYTDRDMLGTLRGSSRLDSIAVAQVLYNNLWSIAYTNTSLAGHCYWLVPKAGDVNTEHIRNGHAILTYAGQIPPKLEVFRTVGPEIFNMITMLDQVITQGMGHQQLSQGELPPNIEAGVALGILEEQENQRTNPELKKYNSMIAEWFILALAIAQDRYVEKPERLLRVVGRNKVDTVKNIDTSKFAGPYDVRVERSSALSESKNLRIQQIMQIKQLAPGAMNDERVLNYLEMSDDKGMYDAITAATDMAEKENDQFSVGEIVGPPLPTDEHLHHLPVHYADMQTPKFREDYPQEARTALMQHVASHEYYLYQKCWENMALCERVMAMPDFPRVFAIDIPVAHIPGLVQQGMTYATARVARQAAALGGVAPQVGGMEEAEAMAQDPMGGPMGGQAGQAPQGGSPMAAAPIEEGSQAESITTQTTDEMGDASEEEMTMQEPREV